MSGNPNPPTSGSNCNFCHQNGSPPTVVFSGPLTVEAGQTVAYSLTVTSGPLQLEGPMPAAGFNLSAEEGMLLATGQGVQAVTFGSERTELTHTAPKPLDGENSATFTFEWQAPAAAGEVTLYAAGNAVNGGGTPNGDLASLAQYTVTVTEAAAVTLWQQTVGVDRTLLTLSLFAVVSLLTSLVVKHGMKQTS